MNDYLNPGCKFIKKVGKPKLLAYYQLINEMPSSSRASVCLEADVAGIHSIKIG